MSLRSRTEQGFTLVEILIVVVILGILAAIVIPQFTSASESAKGSSLVTQLQSIRSQLELYQLQHNGAYPPAGSMGGFENLINVTAADHAAPGAGESPFGPYMQKAPLNPFTADANGRVVAAQAAALTPAADSGWVYNEATGEIRALLTAAQIATINISTAATDGDALLLP
jgi:general secretion pathway protein G